ncbi:hypothetical protein [Mucilaginibacter sp. OK283]|jgi:hypothetical protein|uniref:hypothetical protein n=1 Tax=Mucilaginibacter sp. OK283 TaxID=1881049 RepID=UPI0008CEE074|nr:hypothetical protein [Mucilaginibacter sp. OK283]SEP44950.1 hypothetical protein SAMN05428947_12124 [Mucilaginibacter sp. OK283]
METQIKIVGIILMLLALLHSVFPRYFNWVTELRDVSLVNRQMMYVHTFFIALTLGLMSCLCLTSAHDLVATKLGNRIAFGLGIFWTARLVIQFFGYSADLWRGKRMESAVHIVFSILWLYMSVVFFMIYFNH